MRKLTTPIRLALRARSGLWPLATAAAAVLVTLAATSMTSRAAGSYADDRSEIEDLQARYLFALDYRDPELYVTTFTEDGILDVGSGEIKGRDAIKQTIARMPQPAAAQGMRAAVGRHNISNIVVKINGNKASSRAYWFHYSNDNPKRAGVFDGFGHYEDELVRVKGRWLFAKRRIYNENRDEWAYKGTKNPAW